MNPYSFPYRRALRKPALSFLQTIFCSIKDNFCSASSEQGIGIYKFDLNKYKFENNFSSEWHFAVFQEKKPSLGIVRTYIFDKKKLEKSLFEYPELINKNNKSNHLRYLLSVNFIDYNLHGGYLGNKPIAAADMVEEFSVHYNGENFIQDQSKLLVFDDLLLMKQGEYISKKENSSIGNTEIIREYKARRGQQIFRKNLMDYWGGKCCVTGMSVDCVLKASHIKPWCKSTDEERLSVGNGLLLNAFFDALFDKGMISFSDGGDILISKSLSENQKKELSIHDSMHISKSLTAHNKTFLDFHRKNIFRK